MIRIHNKNLIVEIKALPNESPLEKLGRIQQGLNDMVVCIGCTTAPNVAKENAIYHLHALLQSFQLNEWQYGDIEAALSNGNLASKNFEK